MKIIQKTIRKERGQDKFRFVLKYITSTGSFRYVSMLEDSKDKAKQKLNFRLCGITQSAKIVELPY